MIWNNLISVTFVAIVVGLISKTYLNRTQEPFTRRTTAI